MPTISMFQGILIKMNTKNEHNPPHFHAKYQQYEAQFDFEGNIIKGEFPSKQMKLVAAWAVLHTDELIANWELMLNQEPLYKINPLQ